jgi:adenylate kinase family enzyme
MHNLILGYEKYNFKNWALNGRLEPSTIVCTELQRKALDNYSLQVYDALISEEHKLNSITDIFHNLRYANILKKSIEELIDVNYIYPILIRSFRVYNQFTSHISISEKVRSDVLAKRAKIVILYDSEGHCSLYPDLLANFRNLITQLNLPKSQLYFVHSDADEAKFIDEPYTYVHSNNFPFWLYKYRNSTLIDYSGEKLFLHYSRNLHKHRIAFTVLLDKENLLQDCIYSFGNFADGNFYQTMKYYNLEDQIQKIEYFRNLQNTSNDCKDIVNTNPAAEINKLHYQQTFVSVVSETIVNKDICFFSEKIYKPICIGHPFILIGSPGQLEQLKKYGYKTFDKFWDESYDSELDDSKRLRKIISVLKEIQKLSRTEILQMRSDMADILKYNQQIFNQYTKPIIGLYHQTGLYKTLCSIDDR